MAEAIENKAKPAVYEQHDAAFKQVSAYVIAKDGERVATIAFKFPSDGAGRLYAYVHWLGEQMVRGHAGGYGYDKRTAACASAMKAFRKDKAIAAAPADLPVCMFVTALSHDGGQHWDGRLRAAGFEVWQAV